MGNETPAIRCPRSGRLLTPESLYYWKLKKTLTTLLSSDDDDPVTETPIRERQTKIEMKLEMVTTASKDYPNDKNGRAQSRSHISRTENAKRNPHENDKKNRKMPISTEKTRIDGTNRGLKPRDTSTGLIGNRHNNISSAKDNPEATPSSSKNNANQKIEGALAYANGHLSWNSKCNEHTMAKEVEPSLNVDCTRVEPILGGKKPRLRRIQFTDVYEDSNDSIGKHGKSSEKPTSASDLSTSIIHTPRSRAIQMRIETSSEDEQYATSSYNTDEAEVLSPVLAKATHASASAGSSKSSSSIQFGQENTVNKKDYCCSVIEISSDDDSFQLPANRFKSPEFSQKRTKTSTESQIFSAPPVTPATLKGPRMGKRLAVTEPQKRQKKTSTQKEEPVTERKRSVKINRQSESDNESFDALLSELRNCKLRDDKCNKTQADPNDTLARWESSNKDDRHFLASLSEEIPLEGCHPNAAYYRRQSFNTIRHELTEKLYELFHRIIFQNRFVERLPVSWNNRLLTTAGWCICKKHLDGTKYSEIELSTKVLDRPDRLRDTLVHEMCHAGAWIIHGYKGDHGPLFNFWGQRAGELLGLKVTTCHSYAVEKRYVYKCEKCENEIGRHSKSLDTNKLVCARCKGRFYLRINSGQRW